MRRIFVTGGFITVWVLPFLVSATPASAAAGCGADFDLLTIAETIDMVDSRVFDDDEWAAIQLQIVSLDKNGDGLLCSKHYKPNRGQDKHRIGPEDGDIADYIICLISENNARGRD